MPTLSIIIVSWNVEALLKKCLQSILNNHGNLGVEIIVVDNASSDGTVKMVGSDFPEIKMIANKKNIGYGSANNLGYKSSSGEYILFLNPDTEILPDSLTKTIEFMAREPKIGICGCHLLNSDGSHQSSVRRFPTITAILLILIKIAKIFPNAAPLNRYLAKDFDYQNSAAVDQVMGAYFMTRRQCLERVGLFDEKFFTWFEEVDLCRRMIAAGWQVWYFAGAEIIHHGGQSFKQQLAYRNQKIFAASAWHYFIKQFIRPERTVKSKYEN